MGRHTYGPEDGTAEPTRPSAEPTAPSRPRRELRAFAELLGLCGLAFTQPLLDAFGGAPEVFAAADATPGDVVGFALVVTFVPAAVLWALEVLVGLASGTARRWLHRGVLTVLAAVTGVVVLRRVGSPAPVVVAAVALAVGAGMAWCYRFAGVRRWLAALAVMPLLFVGVFLRASPAGEAVFQPVVATVDLGELTPKGDRSVVLVIFDEFPLDALLDAEGGIDPTLFPHLAALAGDATWFRNTATVATVTSAAVPAILTGRYPEPGRAPVASDYPENLFTLLADGYEMSVEEQITSLCPLAYCHPDAAALLADVAAGQSAGDAGDDADVEAAGDGHGQPVLALARQASTAWRDLVLGHEREPQAIIEDVSAVPATAVDKARGDVVEGGGAPTYQVDAFADLLASIRPDEPATLHFLHLQLPHAPYRFLPNGQAYQSADADGGLIADVGARGDDPYETAAARQRLLLQVGYVDTLVGQLVERLQATGLYDDTVLAITSDHGAGFVPGELKRPLLDDPVAPALYPDLLWVPLLVKAPGLPAGAVDDRNAMSIDLLPTIADLLGIEVPWEVDGMSLLGPKRLNNVKVFRRSTVEEGQDPGFGVALKPNQIADGSAVFADVLARNSSTLLRGENPDHALFDIVAGGELVGGTVEEIGVPGHSGLVAVETTADALASYHADDAYVPVRFTGRVDGLGDGLGDGDQVTVAVALDGVVVGVAPTFDDGASAHRIDLMLDPALVAPGDHEVRLYTVQEDAAGNRRLYAMELG